jgi:hypothetical protein
MSLIQILNWLNKIYLKEENTMGLFSKNDYIVESTNSILNESINTPSMYDGVYDHTTMASAYRIVAEAEQNYTNIMKAVGIEELAAFEEGREFVLEAGFFDNIVAFLKNIWEKIKGLFRKFIATIDASTKSDKDFINKYRTYVTKNGVLKDFKYKGFNYTINGSVGAFKDDKTIISEVAKAKNVTPLANGANSIDDTNKDTVIDKLKKIDEDWDDISEIIRAIVVTDFIGKTSSNKSSNSSSLTAEDAATELFEAYRNGESEKVDLEESDIDIDVIAAELANSAEIKKQVNRTFKNAQKAFDDSIREFERLSKDFMKGYPAKGTDGKYDADKSKLIDAKNKYVNILNKVVTASKNAFVVCTNAYLKAFDERSKQNKAICVALVNRGTNVKTENYSFGSTNESYLGNVKLI